MDETFLFVSLIAWFDVIGLNGLQLNAAEGPETTTGVPAHWLPMLETETRDAYAIVTQYTDIAANIC